MKKSVKQPKKQLKESVKDNLEFVPIELRTLVSGGVKRFSNILGVNQYNIRTFYCEAKEGAEYETFQGAVIGATTAIDMRYLTADIRIFPFFVDQWKKGVMTENDVNDMIAHEVAHIATEDLRKLALSPFKTEDGLRDAWESLTTTVGRLIHKIDTLKHLTNSK